MVFSITTVYVIKHSTQVCRRLHCTFPPAAQFLHDQPFHKSILFSITVSKLFDWNDVDISYKTKYVEHKPCSGILRGPLPRGLLFDRFHILIKMLEACVSMPFPDFQRQVEWCQRYFTKMSLKASE